MRVVVIALAFVLEVAAWRQVVQSRTSVWRLTVPMFAAQGVLAIVVYPIDAASTADLPAASAAGIAVGLALYGATRGFVALAVPRWPAFGRHVAEGYGSAAELPIGAALALSLIVVVPGEELFWRGFVQPFLQDHMPVLSGPALAWFAYIAANAGSQSLPLVAAAVVGGAVWGGLALLTGGVLAPLACHVVWTGLMLAFPPPPGKRMMPA